ncbi:MAG: TadE/TadG family type IV pilus assembly protein [Hyphomicrobiaceae bacterium]|nr:TadE/TadG family type IV pilus assembly protein [Hyphomicrobiaceae bacterium]
MSDATSVIEGDAAARDGGRARLPGAGDHRRGFGKDEDGSVAIMFALLTVVVMSMVGGAIDYGRAVTVRDQIQRAVDASALAAGRVWQTEKNWDLAEAKALEFYDKNKPHSVASSVASVTPDAGRNSIAIEAQATVPTPFLSLVRGPQGFSVSARGEALLAVGGNSEMNLEIAMMLDVTGSMAGSKILDLKAAAKDLIDIVVWDDQSEYTSKVAIVPFANAVNLGSTSLVNSVRGAVKATYCTSSSSPCTGVGSGNTKWSWGSPATWFRFTNNDGDATTWRVSSYCVTERTGADRYTDAAPDTAARKVGPLYISSSSSENNRCGGLLNTSDVEENAVMPLNADKAELKQRIDKLSLAGATAGQLGTAWAWYMLSPSWAYLWPSANRPQPYLTPKLQKIAILMTDGEYNTAHCNGVLSKNSSNGGDSSKINCNASNAIADTQADQLCAAMKSSTTGITVYTVGFALGSNATAIDTLRNCASDTSKFYEAADGAELRQAFRDIALQIAKLRLSQ